MLRQSQSRNFLKKNDNRLISLFFISLTFQMRLHTVDNDLAEIVLVAVDIVAVAVVELEVVEARMVVVPFDHIDCILVGLDIVVQLKMK